MSPISNEIRLVIWIATGIASFILLVLSGILLPNLTYVIRKTGRPPSKKPIWLWVSLWVTVGTMIIGTATASTLPELPNPPSATPKISITPSLTSASTFTADTFYLSDYYLNKQLDLSLLFSIEESRREPGKQSQINLYNALQKSRGVLKFFREHSFAVRDIEFNSTGSLFASASCQKVDDYDHCVQGEIILWKVSDNIVQPISHIHAHSDLVNTLLFSPDNQLLISGSCHKKEDNECIQGEFIVWDISNPKNPIQISIPVITHAGIVEDLAFIPGTNILLTSGCGAKTNIGNCVSGQVIAWEIRKKDIKKTSFIVNLDTLDIKSIAVNNNGKLLATGSIDGYISILRITDVNFSPELITQITTHFDGKPDLSFSKDGSLLFSANSDNAIEFWNISPDNLVSNGQSFGQAQNSIFFDSINNVLLSGGKDANIRLWDLKVKNNPQLIEDIYGAHNSEVYVVRGAPNGRVWASGAKDGTIIIWDFFTNQTITSLPTHTLYGHNSDVISLSISSDEKIAASGSCNQRNEKSACVLGEIILWDFTDPINAKPISSKFLGHRGYVYSLAFNPNKNILASGGGDGNVILWNVTNPESPIQISAPIKAHKRIVQSLAFTPDGNILATGGDDKKLIFWDVSTPQKPLLLDYVFTGVKRVYDIKFISNNSGFIAANGLQKIELSMPISLTEIEELEINVRSVAFDANLNLLASGGRNGIISLWTITDQDDLMKNDIVLKKEEESTILDIAFGNGIIAAAGSAPANSQPTIDVWYLSKPAASNQIKPIKAFSLNGHVQNVLNLSFIHENNFLISSGGDEKIIIWDLNPNSWIEVACQIVSRNFTINEWEKYFPNEPYQETCLLP